MSAHGSGPGCGVANQLGVDAAQRFVSRVRDLSAHELADPRVADLAALRDAAPISPAGLQCGADFGIKVEAHEPHYAQSFARLASGHGAKDRSTLREVLGKVLPMGDRKSLNAILRENLGREMERRGLSANALGRLSGVAPRTIGNYLEPDPPVTMTGKERSAGLREVDKLADALDMSPLELLAEHDHHAPGLLRRALELAALYMSLPPDQRRVMDAVAWAQMSDDGGQEAGPPALQSPFALPTSAPQAETGIHGSRALSLPPPSKRDA